MRAITSPFLQTSKGGKPLKAKKATPSVDIDLAGTSTKVNVHTDKSVDMHTFVEHNTHEYHKDRCPYMYVGNSCDFWLCDCQLISPTLLNAHTLTIQM
jgi:hypothetical protein